MTFRLGITGGIGSGKSGVAGLLRVMGIPVYDCDSEARRLMNSSASIRQGLIALVGPEVYIKRSAGEQECRSSDNSMSTGSPTLNRRLLADYMFGHPERIAAVNALVHPAVREDFRQWTRRHASQPLVALESAILFEAGMKDDVDAVVLVYTPIDERVQRTMARDGITEQAVRARLASQMTDEAKLPLADYVIHNADADAITPQVMQLIERVKDCNLKPET
jgi:dephospho-CoA kinase